MHTRRPEPRSLLSSRTRSPLREPSRTAEPNGAANATSDAVAQGASPEDVYASIPAKYTKPSAAIGTSYLGYSWKAEDLDAVMRAHCIGDAKALIRTAIALDTGVRVMSLSTLTQAARSLSHHTAQRKKFSPAVLADVMTQKGVAEESAMLRTASQLAGDSKTLTRAHLERAADVLNGIVRANDPDEVDRRMALYAAKGMDVFIVGAAHGEAVQGIRLGHGLTADGKKKQHVVISAGVHGTEPCGVGAAMLTIEQLMEHPELLETTSFTIVPMVHRRAYREGTRGTPDTAQTDLNRTFGLHTDAMPPEAKLMRDFFTSSKEPKADMFLDLHSGLSKREGFWVYPQGGVDVAIGAMARLADSFPVLRDHKRPMPAPGVVPSAPLDPSAPSGTLKDLAAMSGIPMAFTVEAPGSISYLDQVLGENEFVFQMVAENQQKRFRA